MYYFKGGANGNYTKVGFLRDKNGERIDIGDCSIPIITDWNSDGLFDLVLGTYGPYDETNALSYEWQIYLNSGTKNVYEFLEYTTLMDDNNQPILATTLLIRDINNDGKNDIVFSLNNDVLFGWYKNIGTKEVPIFSDYEELDVPNGIGLNFDFYELADINNDNVLDLIYVNMYYPYYCLGKKETSINNSIDLSKNPKWEIRNVIGKHAVNLMLTNYQGASLVIYDIREKEVKKLMVKSESMIITSLASGNYYVALKYKGKVDIKSFSKFKLLVQQLPFVI